ncbi:hypothetical protein AB0I28_34005 [Phytomonospora sp. NPDC050363]|uniref:hypothetical protein n=1 Tax=Phytomonospora sp. NPDC050363 TaxID=3155642 RepID=UPI00340151E4
MTTAPAPELLAEALKKAAVAWVSCGGAAARPVWCLPIEGKLYTVVGPGEQPDPGLSRDHAPLITLRGDHGGAILTFTATATPVEPGGERWDDLVGQISGKRLNLSGTDDTAARWAAECVVYELAPPSVGEGD